MHENLSNKFHGEMLLIYSKALKEAGIKLTGFLNMVNKHGGLETAKILVNDIVPSEGLIKLYEAKRLDLTIEAQIIKDEWRDLFTEEEINKAKKKLKNYNFY